MLETFMRRPEQVLSRGQLLDHAWDLAYDARSNVVDVYVRYLRDKIDRPFGRNSCRPCAVWATGSPHPTDEPPLSRCRFGCVSPSPSP